MISVKVTRFISPHVAINYCFEKRGLRCFNIHESDFMSRDFLRMATLHKYFFNTDKTIEQQKVLGAFSLVHNARFFTYDVFNVLIEFAASFSIRKKLPFARQMKFPIIYSMKTYSSCTRQRTNISTHNIIVII